MKPTHMIHDIYTRNLATGKCNFPATTFLAVVRRGYLKTPCSLYTYGKDQRAPVKRARTAPQLEPCSDPMRPWALDKIGRSKLMEGWEIHTGDGPLTHPPISVRRGAEIYRARREK